MGLLVEGGFRGLGVFVFSLVNSVLRSNRGYA